MYNQGDVSRPPQIDFEEIKQTTFYFRSWCVESCTQVEQDQSSYFTSVTNNVIHGTNFRSLNVVMSFDSVYVNNSGYVRNPSMGKYSELVDN